MIGDNQAGKLTKQQCAQVCDHKSSVLFTMMRQDNGFCDGEACWCYCYTNLYHDGNCPMTEWSVTDMCRIIKEGILSHK